MSLMETSIEVTWPTLDVKWHNWQDRRSLLRIPWAEEVHPRGNQRDHWQRGTHPLVSWESIQIQCKYRYVFFPTDLCVGFLFLILYPGLLLLRRLLRTHHTHTCYSHTHTHTHTHTYTHTYTHNTHTQTHPNTQHTTHHTHTLTHTQHTHKHTTHTQHTTHTHNTHTTHTQTHNTHTTHHTHTLTHTQHTHKHTNTHTTHTHTTHHTHHTHTPHTPHTHTTHTTHNTQHTTHTHNTQHTTHTHTTHHTHHTHTPHLLTHTTPALCVAGVALGDIHLRFTWQAWHKLTSTVGLRGRRGTYGTGWHPWAGIWRLWRPGRRGTLRGRRGTNSHLPSVCVAGVALMVLGGALGPEFGACDARGAAALCVAGVALGGIHLRFTWQAWHKLTSTVGLRGRRGTYGTGWRPWAGIWRLWRPGRRGTLRGRRGTWWHPPSFHVAGVAQTHIYRRFAWQAWHLWYWVAPLGRDLAPVTPGAPRHFAWQAWHLVTSTFVSRGRRGTNSHLPSVCVAGVALMVLGGALGPGFGACDARGAAALCVAGVALGDIHLRFTWQAWHKLTSTVVLRGRRGTYGTGWRPWAGIWRLWRPGRRGTLRGRRGTWWHPPSFHVAGVAQTHIYRRFAWQAWHLWYWVAPLGRDLAPVTPGAPPHFAWQAWHLVTSTFVSRGRRGTNSHLPSFCVAGVALMVLGGALGPGFGACDARGAAALCVAGVALGDIHLRFTWQAWHKLTSTIVLRGRRGTYGTGWRPWAGIWRLWRPGRTWWRPPWLHARSFCVAGASLMALGDIHLDFTWHAVWHNLTSMTPAVDHDYIPGMITSHRACRKSSQNLRLRPKECRTLLWSAEVWRARHRFDRGLCHKRSFGKQRREKNHQSLVELEEGEWDTSWDLVFSTHPWIPQRISVVSISCFFSGLQWQVTILWKKHHQTRNFVTHIHIHTFIHTYIQTYIRTYVHTDIHTYVRTYIHIYIYTYIRTCILSFHILSHTVFHHLLCLSFLLRPRYNLWNSLLEEVDLWGYPVL